MKLAKVSIDSFKTLSTKQELLLDPKTTALVGANESGKTNILKAIECLNYLKDLKREDISKNNRARCSQRKLPCLQYTFDLSEDDAKAIGQIFPELSNERQVTLMRSGNGLSGYNILLERTEEIQKLESRKISIKNRLKENATLLKSIEKQRDAIQIQLMTTTTNSTKNLKKMKRLTLKLEKRLRSYLITQGLPCLSWKN